MQKWVRGFVDRQWAALLRQMELEKAIAREAEEAAEFAKVYEAKTNPLNKVGRLFYSEHLFHSLPWHRLCA